MKKHEIVLLVLALLLCVSYGLWRKNNAPWRARSVSTYRVYLPLATYSKFLGRGVAGVPSTALNADWYYVYGYCDAPCVPMNGVQTVGPQGWCAEYELLGNEPELTQWTERPTIPVENIVAQSKLIRAECPDTQIIALNFSQLSQGLTYAKEFIAQGGEFDRLGFHSYCSVAQDCINYIEYVKVELPQVPLCLTEFNTASSVDEFDKLLDYVTLHLDCSAVFIVCWACEGQTADMDLQNLDGTLTAKGQIFSRRDRY